jgi:hypothetical protein
MKYLSAGACLIMAAVMLPHQVWAQSVDPPDEAEVEHYENTSIFAGNNPRSGLSWFTGEVLVWWTKPGPCPALATTFPRLPSSLLPPTNKIGALDEPRTQVVLGGSDIDDTGLLGGRFKLGSWMDADSNFGVEADFLFLVPSNLSYIATSDAFNYLTIPYRAIGSGTQFDTSDILGKGGSKNVGSATLSSNRQVYGAELNGLYSLWSTGGQSWQLLGGYRFFNVDEQLGLITNGSNNLHFAGQFINTSDRFQTQNFFNGGQLGLNNDWSWGSWFLGTTFKVAVGSTHEELEIRGTTTTNSGPGLTTKIPAITLPGGIFAQPTNIGTYDHNHFAWLPEAAVRLGWQITPGVRYYVGYNFLYVSNIVRPGSQIDGGINPTQLVSATGVPTGPLVGPNRPAPLFQTSSFWVMGITVGGEITW